MRHLVRFFLTVATGRREEEEEEEEEEEDPERLIQGRGTTLQ